MLEPEVN